MTTSLISQTITRGARMALAGALVLGGLAWAATQRAEASALTTLSLTLSNPATDASGVTHSFSFQLGTTGVVRAIELKYCLEASGSCTLPPGLSTTGATVHASTTDAYEAFAQLDKDPNGTVILADATGNAAAAANDTVVVALSGVTNPSANSGAARVFFVRAVTYSGMAGTAPSVTVSGLIDDGQVAGAVVPAVTASGVQDAILEFGVTGVASGVSVAGTTTTALSTATTLPFGTFKPVNTTGAGSRVVAHTLNVVTNAATGYTASVIGDAGGLARVGGSQSVGWVGANTTWDEDTDGTGNDGGTTGLGVTAVGAEAGAGFATGGEYEPASGSLAVATQVAPTAGVSTSVVYRVQVSPTLAAGQYQGTIRYSVLPNY